MDEEEIDFRIEAQDVIKDIGFAVEQITVSKQLPATKECAYLNIETKEKQLYCVQLCVQGFRVVSSTFDVCQDNPSNPFYETVYALLDTISTQYVQMFGNRLSKKLSELTSN
ncbi:hypothetical protein QZH41_012733 [Actinostola sp. cb2023]|nr:hypothetical protein QZH41_012733 [Actinostola sp. cb2023]